MFSLLQILSQGIVVNNFLCFWRQNTKPATKMVLSRMSVPSSMFDSRGRTLTICSILFDAAHFKSFSLHGRSKQWATQETQVCHSLASSTLDLSHGAGENSNQSDASTHQTSSKRQEYIGNVQSLKERWLSSELNVIFITFYSTFFS